MNLILWRHAEAEDGNDDMARELTRHGHKQAKRVGEWLEQRLPEDYELIVSPARRTIQTAEGLSSRYRIEPALAPGASAAAVLLAAGWPGKVGTVVVVGHQPTLGEVAAHLLARVATSWTFKRGAAWWFESRARTGPAEIVLRAVITPDFV